MNESTRCLLSLIGLLVLVLVALGATVGCVVWACQPGNGGGIVLAMLVGCMGYGFVQEYCSNMGGY